MVPVADELGAPRQRLHGVLGTAPIEGVVPFGADVDHAAVGADVEGGEAVFLIAGSRPFGPITGSVATEIVLPVDVSIAVVVDSIVAFRRADQRSCIRRIVAPLLGGARVPIGCGR